jgi:hypothetical protein
MKVMPLKDMSERSRLGTFTRATPSLDTVMPKQHGRSGHKRGILRPARAHPSAAAALVRGQPLLTA